MARRAWTIALVMLAACATEDPSPTPPVIMAFVASPDLINGGGQPVTLTWSVSGADSLVIGEEGIDVTGVSQTTVHPSVTTTYTLIASNAFGQTTRATVVTVEDVGGTGTLPVIASFEPVAAIANPGLPNSLQWSVSDADTLTLTGPGVESGIDVSGATTWGPSIDLPPGAVFTLVATNEHGRVTHTTLASRAVATFGVLIAGQSNAVGQNVSPTAAKAFITALPTVRMLGNDYVWKSASEPVDDCTGQLDNVSRDPSSGPCNAGVSFGVSLANHLAAVTGGEVLLIPAAKGGSGASEWLRPADRYDRRTLFGSANHRGLLAETEQGAPLGHTYDGGAYGVIAWFQGETDTTSVSATNAYHAKTDAVFDAFQDELGAPIILAQLSRRGPTLQHPSDPEGAKRNLLYQRVRETQRLMAAGARTLEGSPASQAEARRHLVVTHDLPLADGDGRHLSAEGQKELGRRYALAIREHLLGESVDGSGPRLVGVVKSSNTVLRIHTDRAITAPGSTGAAAYSNYFAVFSGGESIPVQEIRLDPGDATNATVRITLAQPIPGSPEVRYMPPPGALDHVELDVIRSAFCEEPMPGTSACLPMPAFGVAADASTSSALRFFQQFDEPE